MTSAVMRPAVPRTWIALRIYVPVALVSTLIALVGFWPTYFGPLFSGAVQAQPVIHLHAAVFLGWLLLVIAQATLAATGRTALHMKVGKIAMMHGVLVVLVGVVTAFSMFAVRINVGNVQEAQNRLFVPLTDMMVFAPVLAAAWFYRRRPEIHKRLIVVATTILLIAAVHRMTVFGGPPPPLPQLLLVWLAPIYLGMGYDLVKRRIVHPVYLIGIVLVVFLKFLRRPLFDSEVWRDFVGWLTTFYV